MMEQIELLKDLAVVWLAALVGGSLCALIRQPAIAGYIVSGILVGPFGLKLVSQIDDVKVIAEFGVALLLFSLGVEVSLKQIFGSAGRVIVSGLAQILMTIGLAWLLAWLAGWTDSGSGGFLFGCICALSSSVVVTKMLMERGEADTLHGRIIIPTLLLQDLSLVPIMAIVPVLAATGGGLSAQVFIATFKALALAALIGVAATRGVPPLLSWVARSNSRELFLLTIISLCLGIALVSQQAGLSLALGAFLAGLVVSESPYGHQALVDVLPLRDLFSTVFFVSVGMLLNPQFVLNHGWEVFFFVAVLVAGKAALATAAAMVAVRSARTAFLVGLGLAQVGEFSFVLATVAVDSGIITLALYNLFLAGAVVSLIAAPPLMTLGPRLLFRLMAGQEPALAPGDLDRVPEGFAALKGHVIICGFGRVGRNLGRVLDSHRIPYIVIEMNAAIVNSLRSASVPHIYGDALSRQALVMANLREARCLVLTVPEPLAVINAISFARKAHPGLRIIARAHRNEDIEIFREVGASAVVQPEFEASVEITRLVLLSLKRSDPEIRSAFQALRRHRYTLFQPDFGEQDVFDLLGLQSDEHTGSWFLMTSAELSGKTIEDLNVRKHTGATVMAVKRGDEIMSNPQPQFSLQFDDEIYIVGTQNQLNSFEKTFGFPRLTHVSHMTSEDPSDN